MSAPDSARASAVSIVVPARNEEDNLGACLGSLVTQTGVRFEVIVVDDHSSDRTPEIARSFATVKLIAAPPLAPGWTGKNNAMWAGAQTATGNWLLFTDADTVHLPGSLARALEEAQLHGASVLSYSPRQEVHGILENAVMVVIFAELAATYRPAEVCDPASPAAAANGQYLLISRDAYHAVGGHRAIASDLLEDVALARAVKRSGRKIFFRYGGDAVRTRMYRNFSQLREGWTKNLALLFPSPGKLLARRVSEFAGIAGGIFVAIAASANRHWSIAAVAGVISGGLYGVFFKRIRKAHFSCDANLLAIFGLPIFAYLLLRSKPYAKGEVTWKGRRYRANSATSAAAEPNSTPLQGQTWCT